MIKKEGSRGGKEKGGGFRTDWAELEGEGQWKLTVVLSEVAGSKGSEIGGLCNVHELATLAL